MTVVDGRAVRRSLLCAVVHITNIVKLELVTVFLLICIGQVVTCMECSLELDGTLRHLLFLAGDTMHVVIPHGKRVGSRLVVCTLIKSQNILAGS